MTELRYIGDGVYAIRTDRGIWLHTGSHDSPTNRVFLEPEVLDALVRFAGYGDKLDAAVTFLRDARAAGGVDMEALSSLLDTLYPPTRGEEF